MYNRTKKEGIKTEKNKNLQWFATTKEATTKILEIISTITIKGKDSIQLSDIAVLLYVINKMDYGNQAQLPKQKEISQEIGISIRRVSMAITKLQSLKFFIKLEGKTRTYYVNPFYFYIGDYRDLHSKYETWKKLQSSNKK